MEKETPKDKLLKACGVPDKPERDREGRKHPEAMPSQAGTAPARAQQAQDETDKNYRRLDAYIRDELPAQLVQSFEKIARHEIAGSMRTLHDSVYDATCRIDSCAKNLVGDGRIIWLTVLIGAVTVSLVVCLLRWTFIEGKFDEERRYELYGRKVEANIERYKPKEKENLYKAVGGRP